MFTSGCPLTAIAFPSPPRFVAGPKLYDWFLPFSSFFFFFLLFFFSHFRIPLLFETTPLSNVLTFFTFATTLLEPLPFSPLFLMQAPLACKRRMLRDTLKSTALVTVPPATFPPAPRITPGISFFKQMILVVTPSKPGFHLSEVPRHTLVLDHWPTNSIPAMESRFVALFQPVILNTFSLNDPLRGQLRRGRPVVMATLPVDLACALSSPSFQCIISCFAAVT